MASFLTLNERKIVTGLGLWPDTNGSKGHTVDATAPDGEYTTQTNNSGATNNVDATLGRFLPGVAGSKYSFGLWVKKGTSVANVVAGIEWFDSTFTQIGTTTFSTAVAPISSGWIQVVLRDSTAPAGTVWWKPIFRTQASGNTLTMLWAGARAFRQESPWTQHNQQGDAWKSRRARGSLLALPGVRGDCELQVVERQKGRNLSVDVLAGAAHIQGSDIASQGTYYVENDATYNVPFTDPDPVLPRITSIFAKVIDTQFSTDPGPPNPNDWGIIAIDGTPAVGGALVAPATPLSSLRLADVLVFQKTRAITNSNISDKRAFLQTQGPQIFTLDGSRMLLQANTGPWVLMNQQGWGAGWGFIPFAVPFPNKTISISTTDTGPWGGDGKIRVFTLPGQARNGFWVATTYDGAPYRGWLYLRYTALGQ